MTTLHTSAAAPTPEPRQARVGRRLSLIGALPGFFPKMTVHRSPRDISLKTRVGLAVTGLAALLALVFAGFWLHGTRAAIHEEVEAASRVSEQWLRVLALDLGQIPAEARVARVGELVRHIGRVRANRLELLAADGSLTYVSPPPTYKAGRDAPDWFAHLLAVQLPERRIDLAGQVVVLHPDASRAILDAWDDLLALTGWAGLLLLALFAATRLALARALRPLDLLMQALAHTGAGRFDTRLPAFAGSEMGRLARAFNGMADRLRQAVDENVQLDTEREVAQRLQGRLEDERQWIARELHDELAQGITAVRALAGAIAQRTGEQPALHGHAQSIVAVTGEMQAGVGQLLHRLRSAPAEDLLRRLDPWLAAWRVRHSHIALAVDLDPGIDTFAGPAAEALLRIVQEALTNVVRHSGATRARLSVAGVDDQWHLTVADDGRGPCQPSPQSGSGLGLRGMRERLAALGGELALDANPGGGCRLHVRLPQSCIHKGA